MVDPDPLPPGDPHAMPLLRCYRTCGKLVAGSGAVLSADNV